MAEREWPGYGRYIELSGGGRRLRYTAIDPADEGFVCTCKKPDCPRNRLTPIRDHIALVHSLLSRLRFELDEAVDYHDWDAVLYGLQMAASIGDVDADTGYVEDEMVFALCEPTIDYENARSEMASKYVAGLTVFSFLWAAYEARPQLGQRLEGLPNLSRLAAHLCACGGLMHERLEAIDQKFKAHDAVFAAELAREFRNHVFHGQDAVPAHPDWSYGDGVRESFARLVRFYAVGRLLLLLIQGLAVVELEAQGRKFIDEDGDDTVETLLRLHCRPVPITVGNAR